MQAEHGSGSASGRYVEPERDLRLWLDGSKRTPSDLAAKRGNLALAVRLSPMQELGSLWAGEQGGRELGALAAAGNVPQLKASMCSTGGWAV